MTLLLWPVKLVLMKQSPKELIFEVYQDSENGFSAECLTEAIFTQAESWEELREQVKDAVEAYFFDSKEKPKNIRLHLIRDELLAIA